MKLRHIVWILFSALIGAGIAIFFAPGMYSMWFVIIFSGILIYQSGLVTTTTLSAWGKSLKAFAWTGLIAVFLVLFLTRMTGKTLDAATNGTDALSLLLFASLLAIFATREAGWSDGKTGRKWIMRLFAATFIYAILSAVFVSDDGKGTKVPTVPSAIERFVADGAWIFKSYGERKLIKEVKAAGKELKEDLLGEKDPSSPPTAPGSSSKVRLTNVLEPGETRPYHTLAGGPEVKLQIPEWGVWIRNGGKGCVRKNSGPEKCFDIQKYRAEHGNRVPCFNGPLELSILPESRITIQARPSESKDCETED